ncbi:MAG: aerotolerance regulator BatB [Myxococcales bacterium]|nr:aerotolerance regulator BatB [Myxococcales bacterium]
MRIAYMELWWLGLAPMIAIVLFTYASWRRNQISKALGEVHLIELLTESLSLEKRLLKIIMLIIALATLALSGMRPQFGRRSEVQQQSGIDVAVAFDISKSMLARDVQPSRLDAARALMTRLINQLSGHRLALIPFAGIAFTQSPLTADKSAFRLFLRGLNPQQMPIGGTNLAMAIREGVKRLSGSADKGDRASRSRVLLLITDGEDLSAEAGSDVKEAAQEAKDAGILLYAVAVGTRSGEPIPILNKDGTHAGYQRDRSGKPIYSKLNMPLLEEMTRLVDPEGKDRKKVFQLDGTRPLSFELAEAFSQLQKSKLESSVRHRYGEKYAYALIPALLLLLLELLVSDRKKMVTKTTHNTTSTAKEEAV